MSDTKIFNSKTAPVPRIRPDLDIIPVQNNGDSYLYFHDMRGYATPDFALDESVGSFLSLLDGRKSINDLKPYLGSTTTTGQLLKYIQFLDKNRLLYSSHFKTFAEQIELQYEQSAIHHSVTAGNSYPGDPQRLKTYLDEAFERYGDKNQSTVDSIKALYAPHIDPRVGMKSYVQSFQKIRNIKPKRVVMLATSHYSGLYPEVYNNKPFIISGKSFKMPFGTVQNDRETVHGLLGNTGNTGLSNYDRAHRIEHSIELHLLFLSYLWQHEFSIVPILVGSFEDLYYSSGSYLSQQITHFTKVLFEQFGEDNETFFLISGDLAHTGKKFGDERPAASIKQEVRKFDQKFMQEGINGASEDMLRLMKKNYDPYRICGFPPLYTFLKTFTGIKGRQLTYDRWDESERESAVTFGSILYRNADEAD